MFSGIQSRQIPPLWWVRLLSLLLLIPLFVYEAVLGDHGPSGVALLLGVGGLGMHYLYRLVGSLHEEDSEELRKWIGSMRDAKIDLGLVVALWLVWLAAL